MSQSDPHASPLRWTAISITLMVAGLEFLVLGLIAHVWVGGGYVSSDIWTIPIHPIAAIGPGYVMATGAVLTVAGFIVARRPRAASPEETRPAWSVVSAALFVIGLLVLIPSGLCSAFAIAESGGRLLIFVLIYGGVPIAIGATLAGIGLGIRRSD